MEGVSTIEGADFLVTGRGLGVYYYSLMTVCDIEAECKGVHKLLKSLSFRMNRALTKS
ncbi:hypothetical protein FHX08_001995 [Rhizobium sp. BK529]|nr:hypothetical protein [Rhizobium sp. BK529]TCS08403.1 hypothetical protein EV281_101262 [Rhizobium sp. BK418]